jgi:3D (Asp-Asp-Asp) domain-containing protein
VTAYVVRPSEGCTVNEDRTSSGTVPRWGTIAVDPSVFEPATRFYVPGYGYGRAEDTGSAVKGYHIDIAMLSCSQALRWGARYLNVQYAD